MRSTIKLSLLALLGAAAVVAMPAGKAWAGNAGTTSPDSGGINVDGGFAPSNDSDAGSTGTAGNTTPAAITGAISVVLETIESSQSVTSPRGRSLPLSPTQAATISAALSSTGAGSEPAIAALEQQLAVELGTIGIDVSVLGSTPVNLETAIAAANTLINTLTSEQLAAAIESPTFVAIRAILAGGKDGESRGTVSGGGATGIPFLSTP